MNAILKQPLLHFFALGLALFVLFDAVAGDGRERDPKTIEVDRDALLTFIQFRSRTFEPSVAARRLDNLPPADLERLIADYVTEEALYREALALGMDRNDYVIKQRLIQSMEFVTSGVVSETVALSDQDLKDYYAANRADYYVEPHVTFTHVFFGTEHRSRDDALVLARAAADELNRNGAAFEEAARYGERFPYFLNYVERDADFITGHFGAAMARAIFALPPDTSAWQGPLESSYGAHVVMLTRKTDGRYLPLDEIRQRVRQDAERAHIEARKRSAIKAIVDEYRVHRNLAAPKEPRPS